MSTAFAFQDTSVARISAMLVDNQAAILGHDPGLGKTIIAIRVADFLSLRKILVVSTVSSLYNWQREFDRWGQLKRTVKVVTNTSARLNDIDDDDVIVMAYSQLSGVTRTLSAVSAIDFDLVIFDEAHALKSCDSKRTRAAYFGVTDKAGRHFAPLLDCTKYVLSMSGTLTSNHYGELYTHLEAMQPEALDAKKLRDYDRFLRHFCKVKEGNYGPVVYGNRNVPELRELLKPVFHRFSRKRVLKDLPELIIEEKILPTTADVLVEEARLEEAMANAGIDIETLPASAVGVDGALATERRLLGMAKVKSVVGFVIDEMANAGEKMIVFAHHRDVLALLNQQLAEFNPVLIQGGMPADERDKAIQKFQNDEDCRLFLGQIDSAGEAITLTAANRVAFAEFSWDPGKNYQAILRAHRIGQTRGVLAQFLVVEGSLDEAVGRVVARKTKMTADLFG